MHTSLANNQPRQIEENSICPRIMVIGPGGLSDAYPFQPPKRAIIQAAQDNFPKAWGFFCLMVFPSNLFCKALNTLTSSGTNRSLAERSTLPSRANVSCIV